jgi:hypothetical protein
MNKCLFDVTKARPSTQMLRHITELSEASGLCSRAWNQSLLSRSWLTSTCSAVSKQNIFQRWLRLSQIFGVSQHVSSLLEAVVKRSTKFLTPVLMTEIHLTGRHFGPVGKKECLDAQVRRKGPSTKSKCSMNNSADISEEREFAWKVRRNASHERHGLTSSLLFVPRTVAFLMMISEGKHFPFQF